MNGTRRRDRPVAFALTIVVVCLLAAGSFAVIVRATPAQTQTLTVARPPDRPAPTTTTTSTTAPPPPPVLPAEAAPPPAAPAAPTPPRANGAHRDGRPVVQIGTIEIPKIGLVHAIYEGNTLTQIDHGPSHWPGTAMPGQRGNSVFAGHRVTKTHPFRHIDQLVAGDLVHFTVAGVRSTYRMTEHQVVTPRDTWIINPTPAATATLFACHPPGSARYRYVVRLELVP